VINQVRCFRARSAAFDIVSNNVQINRSLTDNTIPTASTTAELPGGVGIRARRFERYPRQRPASDRVGEGT
jgi:hypothetical protein